MHHRNRGARRTDRGVTLLEALVSLSILLVGMLGLVHLQIYGITANGGARAHTVAMQLARELAGGLERLPTGDALLSGGAGEEGVAPEIFGRLILPDGSIATGAHEFDDTDAAVPGVRLDATLEQDGAGEPMFKRRWAVWDTLDSGSGVATKIIAVSVIYRERGAPLPREVVVYTHVANRAFFGANVGAYN